jgi:dolichol-phosphate mannosyltransferase
MKISLIVPTLREAKNLQILIPEACNILKAGTGSQYELIIVDDDSHDGTEELVKKLSKKYKVRVIVRKGEKGLSSAVIRGFKEAKGDYLIVMDADLSHPIVLLKKIIEKAKQGYDVIVPNRYIKGGGAEKWPLVRKVISRVATSFARFLTRVEDPMSGYFAMKRDVIKGITLNPIGYKIFLEILVKGKYDRKNIVSIPYVFRNRILGTSKLKLNVYLEYIAQLFELYAYSFKKLFSRKKS